MKNGFKALDVEPHIEEPYDLWEQGLPDRYRSRLKVIPPAQGHLEPGKPSFELVGDTVVVHPAGEEGESSLVWKQSMARWPSAPHLVKARVPHATPEVYLEGFDIEGLDVAMLMPSHGAKLLGYDYEPEFALAICETSNNFAHDFTRTDPDRMKFWAMVPPHDPELAVEEARRGMEELGAVGVTIAAGGAEKCLLNDEPFDVLWQELDRLHAPVGLHGFGSGGAVRRDDPGHQRTEWIRRFQGPHAPAVAGLIFGGLLDRYPNIKPIFMESGVNGVPYMLESMDDAWSLFGSVAGFKLSMLPSEYYRTRCYAVTYAEGLLKYTIDYMGDDNLLFSTDYPHHDSPFPNGVSGFLKLDRVSDESKRKILWDNGARLFGLEDPEKTTATAPSH